MQALGDPSSSLVSLSLRDTALGSETFSALGTTIASGACKIEYLDLRENPLCGHLGLSSLMAGIAGARNALRVLYLARNGITVNMDDVSPITAALMSPHCRLETLEYSDQLMSDRACAAWAGALAANTTLRSLSLSDNFITCAGALTLCTALGKGAPNATLASLDLRGNVRITRDPFVPRSLRCPHIANLLTDDDGENEDETMIPNV